jgi:hypothetical protein
MKRRYLIYMNHSIVVVVGNRHEVHEGSLRIYTDQEITHVAEFSIDKINGYQYLVFDQVAEDAEDAKSLQSARTSGTVPN